jgi:hypothetical protein
MNIKKPPDIWNIDCCISNAMSDRFPHLDEYAIRAELDEARDDEKSAASFRFSEDR